MQCNKTLDNITCGIFAKIVSGQKNMTYLQLLLQLCVSERLYDKANIYLHMNWKEKHITDNFTPKLDQIKISQRVNSKNIEWSVTKWRALAVTKPKKY